MTLLFAGRWGTQIALQKQKRQGILYLAALCDTQIWRPQGDLNPCRRRESRYTTPCHRTISGGYTCTTIPKIHSGTQDGTQFRYTVLIFISLPNGAFCLFLIGVIRRAFLVCFAICGASWMQPQNRLAAGSTPRLGFESLSIFIWIFVGGFLSRCFQIYPGE